MKYLYRILIVAEGTSFPIKDLPKRLKKLLLDVFFQFSVRKDKPIVGWAHSLIFWGFITITIGSMDMVIGGIIPALSIVNTFPNFHDAYLFISDLAILGVVLACCFGLYRRFFLKPSYLTNGVDAKFILFFTIGLMLSLLGLNIFHCAYNPASFSDFFISKHLAELLGVFSLNQGTLFFGVEFFYWLHLLMILIFLVYIPHSKHLHIVTAIPNIFFSRVTDARPLEKTNFEDESLENYGASNVKQLSWKSILDAYTCTECGRCEEVCPATNTGKPLSPKKIINDLRAEILKHSDKILSREKEVIGGFVQENGEISPDVIWSCTTCRACEAKCPIGIEQITPIIESRRNLVQMESKFPKELQTIFKNLETNYAPWAFPHSSRADWCKDLDVKEMSEHPNAEVLYYVGCAGSFDDRAKKVATAIVKLLKMANVDFAILGKEEKCNGDPARRAGNEYMAQMLIKDQVDVLNKYKPRKILAACPHCFNTLKNEYPEFGAQYDVVHHSTFLLNLVQENKIPLLKKESMDRITYHDSCYLGRWNGVYEAPRALLKEAGIKIDEVARSKENGFCCGAGGARMFMEETIGKKVNVNRVEEMMDKRPNVIAANCPFCTTMLSDGIKAKDKQELIVVKDIAEILLDSTVDSKEQSVKGH